MALALTSMSPLSINSLRLSYFNVSTGKHFHSKSSPVVSLFNSNRDHPRAQDSKKWGKLVSATLAAAVIAFSSDMSALADLNKYEAELRGEFGIGSAAQFGSADLKNAVHVNENFRRANFTAADMRESDFSGSTFNGAYLEKAVAYKANFTGDFWFCLVKGKANLLEYPGILVSETEEGIVFPARGDGGLQISHRVVF